MLASGSYTLDAALEQVVGRAGHILVLALNFLFFIAVLAAQFVAFNSLLSVMVGDSNLILLLIFASSVITYTALSGYPGVLKTDRMQLAFVAVGLFLLFLNVTWTSNVDSEIILPASYFNGTGFGVTFLVGALLFFPFTMLVRTDLWQRIASSADKNVAKRSLIWAALLLLPIYFVIFWLVFEVKRSGFSAQTPETALFEFLLAGSGSGVLSSLVVVTVFVSFLAALAGQSHE